MNIEDEVISLAQKLEYTKPAEIISEQELNSRIDVYEKRYKINFPEELKRWWFLCNKYAINPGRVSVITTNEGMQHISWYFDTWNEYKWISNGWFPITDDGCGDYYVLDNSSYAGKTHPVLFIDQCDYEKPDYVVASGLFRFLRFFYIKELLLANHLLEESYWPFDRERIIAEDPDIALCTVAPLPWESDEVSDT